jgi:hypothetical protein
MACYLAVCACSELIFPTGALHFRASVTQATDGEKIVRAFSITSSARNQPSGFRDPEGSFYSSSLQFQMTHTVCY